jgi:hypothetical protein
LSWEIYDNLDEIKEKVRAFLEDFSYHTIASIVISNKCETEVRS